MSKTINTNDLFQSIEASRFCKENGVPMVRISYRNSATKKGPQITMTFDTRITDGADKGYVETSESIWPRAFHTTADLELLEKSVVKDILLRFGKKTVKKVTEDGEEVEVEEWGAPKWVAWFDGKDWHELHGAKVPFEVGEPSTEDFDDDDEAEEGEEEEEA